MSLAKNIEFLRQYAEAARLERVARLRTRACRWKSRPAGRNGRVWHQSGRFADVFLCTEELRPHPALVVVLHGCGQTAAGYDLGTGWSTLAKHYGFALLMPEQQRVQQRPRLFQLVQSRRHQTRTAAKPVDPADDRADGCSQHRIDKHRIFITGLSAGGAMTSVMLATYPEVFAAGAIIAGLPYGVAANVREAFNGMMQSPARARRANSATLCARPQSIAGRGPRFRCGTAAPTAPSIPPTPTRSSSNGSTCISCLPIRCRKARSTAIRTRSGGTRMAKPSSSPTPSPTWPMARHLGKAENDERYGKEGAFLIEAGISSSYHIANFFGLTADSSAENLPKPPRARQRNRRVAN